jgi:hypothetical protein
MVIFSCQLFTPSLLIFLSFFHTAAAAVEGGWCLTFKKDIDQTVQVHLIYFQAYNQWVLIFAAIYIEPELHIY